MKVTSNYLQEVKKDYQRAAEIKAGDNSFAEILKQSRPEENKGPLNFTGNLSANSLVGQIMANQIHQSQNISKGPEAQLEETLKAMDQYAQALGDPAKSLKEVAPLADELSRSASILSQVSQNLAADNPLKKLTGDTAVLATVESMKFKRGDFV